MSLIILENEALIAKINPKGAELVSLINKNNEIEYMWKGDPAFWPKHSPVLFPIVGALKEDTYIYQGVSYALSRHGFARDMMFEVEERSTERVVFTLKSTEDTKAQYPFNFVLKIHYSLTNATLKVNYEVINPAQSDLYFSVGAHPAFAVPLVGHLKYEDYYLQFDQKTTAKRWPLAQNLIKEEGEAFLNDEQTISLKPSLFYEDAIVIKNIEAKEISLKTDKDEHGLNFTLEGFPFLGIWAAKDAPFVCIEPWCGVADSVNHNQQLQDKEGIICLTGNSIWNKSWQVECY